MGAIRGSGEVPARLEGVQRRFERWRRKRKARTRIPEPLWAAAVKAAGRYGIHRTAKVLLLDYYALKRRVEEQPAAVRRDTGRAVGTGRGGGRREGPTAIATEKAATEDAAATFFELPAAAWRASGECTVEWEDGSGAVMRVHIKGFAAPDLAALSRSFWDPAS
jgi:hypothetical protein